MYSIRALAFFAVLSVGMIASAAEWPLNENGNVEITGDIYVVDQGDPYGLGSVTVTAPTDNDAGLIIGGDSWTGSDFSMDSLTMTGTPNSRAVVVINNSKSLTVNTATLNASSFIDVGYDYGTGVSVAESLTVEKTLNLEAVNAQIRVSERGILTVNHVILNAGSIQMDGEMVGKGTGALDMNGGTITVGGTGTMTGFNEVNVNAGGFNITANGTVTGGAGSSFKSSGIVSVEGSLGGFDTVTVDGGSFTVASTGILGSSLVHTAGAVEIEGRMEGSALEITTSGDTLLLSGSAKTLGNLDVSETANVTVKTNVSTPLVMTGGTMTLAGGTLTMKNTGSLGGVWNMDGGSAAFDGAVIFSGGTINVNVNGGGFTMNGAGDLRIESSLNVNDDMTVAMNGGAFVLNGGYHVGNSAGSYAMLTVTGSGTFGVEAGTKITLDTGARREYNGLFDQGDTTMLILGTAGLTAGTNALPGSLTWTSGTSNYTFDVVNGDDGYGLYVTGVTRLTRPETEQGLLDRWSQHPNVDGNVGRVFNDSFIDAVVDGSLIAENENIRATLDPSGKVNAEALAKILEGPSATGYDALMLYNGAGLTAANDAVLNVNRHFLRRVSDRAGVIRREVIVDELEQPETVNEAEDPNRRLYGDPAATRLWAEGLVYSDSAGGGEGFAGYDYSGRGLMIGADKRENDIWYGAALAYLPGSFEDKAARSGGGDIDTYAMLAHAGWQDVSGLYVTGTLGYAYADNALRDTRTLGGVSGTNEADFGTHSFMVALEAGSDFHLGDYLIITPSAGLAYVTSRGGAHQQWFTGAGGVGAQTIDAGKITGSSFSLPLGLAASMDVYGDEDSLLSITGKAGYAYELQNKGARGEFNYGGLGGVINPVSAASRAPGRHTWNLGLSARYLYDNMEFGLGYEYLGRGESTTHSVTFSAGVNF